MGKKTIRAQVSGDKHVDFNCLTKNLRFNFKMTSFSHEHLCFN